MRNQHFHYYYMTNEFPDRIEIETGETEDYIDTFIKFLGDVLKLKKYKSAKFIKHSDKILNVNKPIIVNGVRVTLAEAKSITSAEVNHNLRIKSQVTTEHITTNLG